MIKKYPWNEPNPKKRWWTVKDYYYKQWRQVLIARKHHTHRYPLYGNIDDLDPRLYNSGQMKYISLCRGLNNKFGNIDDLNPKRYDKGQMYWSSLGRGSDKELGNIDDLDPRLYDSDKMLIVSKGRGTDKSCFLTDHIDPDLYSFSVFQTFSFKGFFHAETYREVSPVNEYQKTLKTIKENNPEWLI